MEIRITKPKKGNKFYTTVGKGGYSQCVKGKPTDACDVLANCVGYACGRFNEIIGSMKYPKFYCNAENFIEVAKSYGLKVVQYPTLGGIMVWQKGSTLSGKDGAGHVAVVERIDNTNQIYTSESGYGYKAFYNVLRKNNNGRWGMVSGYKFRGCIVNPKVGDVHAYVYFNRTVTLQKALNKCGANLVVDGIKGVQTTAAIKKYYNKSHVIRWVQENLNNLGYNCGKVDGIRGKNTKTGTIKYQRDNNLRVDGIAGVDTISSICKK